tara:strand:- start:41 stop:442 length:402 start_codon:yes stop_codon:yes gene_type:complete
MFTLIQLTWTLKIFIKMVKEKVVPGALEKTKSRCKKIVIQIDSTGAHGVSTSVSALNYTVELMDGPSVDVVTIRQPSKSPDLNVLDLGAWVLQVAVDKYKRDFKRNNCLRTVPTADQKPTKPTHQIIRRVQAT